ncbi:hypothetical protein PANT_6c00094 [Moesziomyces antarcticus T-34]|uniref:Uncharacterized protein n=1 Tax=Pseudozyma antarctica (strain T-34) TaxID=1151754 RepID=M9MB39_PSEA3|nr:hypothetical protein PANT_6c00094 [Moesziomyces antarcticus T-34]
MSAASERSSAVTSGDGGVERTLRRRRSAASAALLSRPSMHTLAELVPSFETCVLVHVCTSSNGADGDTSAELVYALFEPNFLVDGTSSTVRGLDRTSWERLRSHVEELRIVAISSRCGAASPKDAVRKPDCIFDLCTDRDTTQRSVSQIFLQPTSNAVVPAKSLEELLEIDIVAPADPNMAKQRRIWLPTQVRNILDDADHLVTNSNASFPTTPASAPLHLAKPPESQAPADFQSASARILNLVRGQPTTT